MNERISFTDLEPKYVTSLTEYIQYWRQCLKINNIHNMNIQYALNNVEKKIKEHPSFDVCGSTLTEIRELIERQLELIPVLA